jgi:hypothetical protein
MPFTKEDVLIGKITRQALEIGRANAEEVFSFRAKALRRWSQAIAKRAATLPAELATAALVLALVCFADPELGL